MDLQPLILRWKTKKKEEEAAVGLVAAAGRHCRLVVHCQETQKVQNKSSEEARPQRTAVSQTVIGWSLQIVYEVYCHCH